MMLLYNFEKHLRSLRSRHFNFQKFPLLAAHFLNLKPICCRKTFPYNYENIALASLAPTTYPQNQKKSHQLALMEFYIFQEFALKRANF